MSHKHITLTLTPAGMNDAIKQYNTWRKGFERKCNEFLRALAEEGVEVAQVEFLGATYDGTNDVKVELRKKNDSTIAVVAVGTSVLFIEFGSGVVYTDDHPEAKKLGMIRGEYGYKMGRREKGWRYSGDPGTNGEMITTGRHAGQIHTVGNPANMCMYGAKKVLEERFTEIAKRVFK